MSCEYAKDVPKASRWKTAIRTLGARRLDEVSGSACPRVGPAGQTVGPTPVLSGNGVIVARFSRLHSIERIETNERMEGFG